MRQGHDGDLLLRHEAQKFVTSVPAGTTVEISSGGQSVTIEGGREMVGVQTAYDPETGEIMDAAAVQELYTETSLSGKQTIAERLRLGERVAITAVAQVVAVGEELDKDGLKVHTQKLRIESIDEVTRGAL